MGKEKMDVEIKAFAAVVLESIQQGKSGGGGRLHPSRKLSPSAGGIGVDGFQTAGKVAPTHSPV